MENKGKTRQNKGKQGKNKVKNTIEKDNGKAREKHNLKRKGKNN